MTAQDESETSLFRDAVSGIKPLTPQHHAPATQLPPPRPRQLEADNAAVLRELLAEPALETLESGDTLAYRANGVQDGVFRKLRRGQYRIEKELDLHGLNRDKAREVVTRFLAYCHDHDLRCVRIIHGKGNGSPNSGPVLKTALDSWLRRRQDVVAFCSARPADGGTGALYVLLRAAKALP